MRISEFLLEYRDADLYHGTSLSKAEDIIMSNMMHATRPIDLGKSMQVKGDHKGGWQYIVSFSRSFGVAARFAQFKSQKYSTDDLHGVVFVLDQDAIRRDCGKRLQSYNDMQYISRAKVTEHEEALLGDLKNLSKYLKKFYILVPDSERLHLQDVFKVLFEHPKAVVVTGKKRKPHGTAYPSHREIER